MERHDILAKLKALRNSLGNPDGGPSFRDIVIDIFSRYEHVRDILVSDYSNLFDDLPIRPLPPTNGNAEGRKVIARNHLLLLEQDITYCLDILQNTEAPLPAIDISREGVFFAGQYFDALQRANEILFQAQQDIVIIDGYVNQDVLNILTAKTSEVTVRILTMASSVSPAFIAAISAFNKQYSGLTIRTSAVFHDRFVIIDDKDFFHFGASIKDLGHRGFMFSKIEELVVIESLRTKLLHEWENAKDAVSIDGS